ncbi:MAG: DUF1641 domain-containing protein [Gemmatimonadetes bacterium]|nr:MAG: DUF1641 domain-containing protein [Gemmatimonadota bacterium]
MEQTTFDQQLTQSDVLAGINQKLDVIMDYIRQEQRRKRELKELQADLTLIGKDAFNAAIEELDDVAGYFDTADLIFLGKKLLRNTRNLTHMLDQVESAADLFEDLKPLSKQMFNEWLEILDEFDRKGYFEFLRESVQIFDEIVTNFTPQDVRLLRQNIVSILNTIRNYTQPDMIETADTIAELYREAEETVEHEKISTVGLLKQMGDPEVKRGLTVLIHVLKGLGHHHPTHVTHSNTHSNSH